MSVRGTGRQAAGGTWDPGVYRASRMNQERQPAGDDAPAVVPAHVCTIATSWSSTIRLADTLRAHHPDRGISVLVIDDPPAAVRDRLTVDLVRLSELPTSARDLAELQLIYDADELAGALVPRLLQALLARGVERLLFLACTMEIHGSLEPLDRALARHPAVLCRRTPAPPPDDGLEPSHRRLLSEGNVHPGHLAVTNGAEGFLQWWADRTRWDALHDLSAGLWGAGRWLELAVGLFDVGFLDEAGFAVGATNLDGAAIEVSGGRVTIAGTALRTFDASGFDPARREVLDARLGGDARVLTRLHPGLEAVLQDRSDAIRAADELAAVKRQDDLLDPMVRRMARAELHAAATTDRQPRFEAGTPDEADFVRWLSEPVATPGVPISRLLHAVWATRPDLQAHFPRPLGADGAGLVAWAAADETFRTRYGPLQVPPDLSASRGGAAAPGFNIVGYLHGELGLGEAGRLIARAASLAGVPFCPVAFSETQSRQSVEFAGTAEAAPYDATILCVNADLTPLASARTWGALDADRHRIGYWFWEVDRFPVDQAAAVHYVDELWAASDFVATVLRSVTDKPVTVVPHPVAPVVPTHLTRGDLGLPDRFTFGFWFDCYSGVERKNPAALIEAFCRAFAVDEGPVLLLKAINGGHDRLAMERLHLLAAGRPDIKIIDEYWTGVEMRALVQHLDCYVSLHRSEGFGQTMADAMAASTPVIATGHSGNLAFMNETNSYLVPFELVPVGAGNAPYPEDAAWAEPDIGAAAELMRRVATNPSEAAERAATAACDIQRRHGLEVTAAHLRRAFQDVLAG